MSRSLNKVMLIGHLGADAEQRFTPSGVSVMNLRVATNRRFKDSQTGEWKDETEWHRVTLWRNENLAQYLQKGKQLFVEGRLQTRSWEDQSGNKRYSTEVVADNVMLLSGRGAGGDFEAAPSQGATQQAAAGAPSSSGSSDFGDQGITDEDVPF